MIQTATPTRAVRCKLLFNRMIALWIDQSRREMELGLYRPF